MHSSDKLAEQLGGFDYDYIIIGSGFGGSVSALRLAEKGYKVAVIEQGKWYSGNDFAKRNWQLNRWLWKPSLRLFGIMRITFMRHVTVLSGVGVGGGSLVYACTLPVPKAPFFKGGSWGELADWQTILQPYYALAYKMLGAADNPTLDAADLALQHVAAKNNRLETFHPTKVGIFFGSQQGKTVADPFFDGQGPERKECIRCGACMTGCRHNAKNSLDKNYLYLAQKLGVNIQAESRVVGVTPLGDETAVIEGSQGYEVTIRDSTAWLGKTRKLTAKGIVFAGGVLGTVPLLLKLKATTLPKLSDQVGMQVRTNNESLIGVSSLNQNVDYSKGIAIGSIFHPDEHSHIEVCRYGHGSGFWRTLLVPRVGTDSPSMLVRLGSLLLFYVRHPIRAFKLLTLDDWAKRTPILLFMQHLDSTLQLKRFGKQNVKSAVAKSEQAPSAFIPAASRLASDYATHINGVETTLANESVLGIPGTAHILGGAVMAADASVGVIDQNNRVFGYANMLVCDGSMISANPGVNPSLSITAISEHAMSLIANKA